MQDSQPYFAKFECFKIIVKQNNSVVCLADALSCLCLASFLEEGGERSMSFFNLNPAKMNRLRSSY